MSPRSHLCRSKYHELVYAVVQVEASPSTNVKIAGRIAYLLWRSVYAVKQVDVRNRVSHTEPPH